MHKINWTQYNYDVWTLTYAVHLLPAYTVYCHTWLAAWPWIIYSSSDNKPLSPEHTQHSSGNLEWPWTTPESSRPLACITFFIYVTKEPPSWFPTGIYKDHLLWPPMWSMNISDHLMILTWLTLSFYYIVGSLFMRVTHMKSLRLQHCTFLVVSL